MEKLFPGQGYSLSPEKTKPTQMQDNFDSSSSSSHIQSKRVAVATDVKYETLTTKGNSCK